MTKVAKFSILLVLIACYGVAALASDPAAKKSAKSADKVALVRNASVEIPREIQWLGFDAGLSKAKAEKKSVVIDFYTNWCGWCKRMDATTFHDSTVIAAFNKNFVGIRVNAEDTLAFVTHEGERMTQRQLTRVFAVTGYPTYWFLDSDGKKIGPAPGYKAADAFVPLLRYVGEGHYKSMSYDAFVKKGNGKG